MKECNRCGWKRKPKSKEVIEKEYDQKHGIIRDEDGKEIMRVKHRIAGVSYADTKCRNFERTTKYAR